MSMTFLEVVYSPAVMRMKYIPVATLLNAEQPEGSYTMEWNGKDTQGLTVPTGMYLIRMTAGEYTTSRKVMLMK